MTTEIFGVAYYSPIFIRSLINPRKYTAVMLVSDSLSLIRAEVEAQLKRASKTLVIVAGSLDILQSYLKAFPEQPCKIVLCDIPPAIYPCVGPMIRWLDCDQQIGGAWQVAKLMIEDLDDQLDLLSPLTSEGRTFIQSMTRLHTEDRLAQLRKLAESMPREYTQLIASLSKEQNKSPLKAVKEARKTKETLGSLLRGTLLTLSEHKEQLAPLVLDYETSLIGKRDYLSKINSLVKDETIKKDFLTLRKWMDSKSGILLQEAFFDYIANHERRSWQTILDSHKKVSEEDLLLLLSYCGIEKAAESFAAKLTPYLNLPSDKQAPKKPNRPILVELSIFLGI